MIFCQPAELALWGMTQHSLMNLTTRDNWSGWKVGKNQGRPSYSSGYKMADNDNDKKKVIVRNLNHK